jgi:Flp pilus assembly protein TadG
MQRHPNVRRNDKEHITMLIALYIKKIYAFVTDRCALAAIEFAFIAPFLVVLLYGSTELFNYLSFQRHAENAGASIIRSLTENVADAATPHSYQTSTDDYMNMRHLLPALLADEFNTESSKEFYRENYINIAYVNRSTPTTTRRGKTIYYPQVKWGIFSKNDPNGWSDIEKLLGRCSTTVNTRTNIYPFSWATFPDINEGLDTIVLQIHLKYKPLLTKLFFPNLATSIDSYFFAVPRYVNTITLSIPRPTRSDPWTAKSC